MKSIKLNPKTKIILAFVAELTVLQFFLVLFALAPSAPMTNSSAATLRTPGSFVYDSTITSARSVGSGSAYASFTFAIGGRAIMSPSTETGTGGTAYRDEKLTCENNSGKLIYRVSYNSGSEVSAMLPSYHAFYSVNGGEYIRATDYTPPKETHTSIKVDYFLCTYAVVPSKGLVCYPTSTMDEGGMIYITHYNNPGFQRVVSLSNSVVYANFSPGTATYARNGKNLGAYSSGSGLRADGVYVITLNYEYGGETFTDTRTLMLDATAPSLSTSSPNRTSVSASWSVGKYESDISARYSYNGSYFGEYTSGTRLTDEGRYVITARDEAGNSTSVTLYVDRTAPVLNGSSPNNSNASVTWSVGIYESNVTATYTLNGTPQGAYTSGTQLSAEGRYVITSTDEAGNSTSITAYVDRSAPVLNGSSPNNSNARVTWNVGENESAVNATYTLLNTSGTFGPRAYTSGTRLTDEGRYVITATDEAGNSTSITAYVDRTAPSLSQPEPSKSAIATSWTVSEHESAVNATVILQTSSGTSSPTVYTSGTQLVAEGRYVITATDEAGNSTSITAYVDRTAPRLTSSSPITRTSTNAEFSYESYETAVIATYSCDGSILGAYTSRQVLSLEGDYVVTAIDAAGNTTMLRLIVDKTAPKLSFVADGVTFERYTSTAFLASALDTLSGVSALEILTSNGWTAYDYSPRGESGAYSFRLTDNAGNVTTAIATVYKTDTFGNYTKIANGYKLNSWYIVNLPARIFTTTAKDIAGRYSFDAYENALAFAIAKEREFRVSEVQGGFMYVSPTNETVSQKYTDEATLAEAVNKYAQSYVSSRQVSAGNGADRYYIETESLTRNALALPDFLDSYKGLSCKLMRSNVTFSLPNVSFIADMPYTVTATYLGDISPGVENEVTIPKGSTLRSALGEKYMQGWYLISESDEAGNKETYLIYSDAELPTIKATATTGNGTRDITVDYTFTHNEAMYFLTFNFNEILDNIDEYLTIKLERGTSAWYFTQDDVLPKLGSDNYTSGKYTVTLFDRSLNTFVFDVYIAGAAPSWSHTSLASDRADCTVTFVTSDRNTVLTSISLYKIEYDGSRTAIVTDGNGTAVSALTLSYVLTSGGKYGATVTDNFARTVELDPVFFLKGLPNGSLSGVSDGGRTNKNVSFTFSNANTAIIYKLDINGTREVFSDYTTQINTSNTTYSIMAIDTNSSEYLVFLYAKGDMSLYVEYTFEIDTIIPDFYITNSDGAELTLDGATNKPFSLSWNETTLTVRYYTSGNNFGTTSRYSMGTLLYESTLYYFTVRDDVGNSVEFTVLLDNSVDYSLSGTFNTFSGILYTNAAATLTVNEPTQEFRVTTDNCETVLNGGEITLEGKYVIEITDNYNNSTVITIVIDYTPPTVTLDGVASGDTTKRAVTVSAENYDHLRSVDSRGNILRDVESGEVFELGGTYYITASDLAGNSATVSFTIDLGVDYELSVPNGAITTKPVIVKQNESLRVTVLKDGEDFETASSSFKDVGSYTVTLTDSLDNFVTVTFRIIAARHKTLDLTMPDGTIASSATKDGATFELSTANRVFLEQSGEYVVTLNCSGEAFTFTVNIDNTPPNVTLSREDNAVRLMGIDKESVSISLTRNGTNISARIGTTLTEPGSYVLTVTDDLGNVSVIEFTIDYRMNTWAIVVIVIASIAAVVILLLIIRARCKPRVN